jgi:cytochrome b561
MTEQDGTAKENRYHGAIVILHWVMALAFFGMLGSGLVMTSDLIEASQKFPLYQTHKAMGVLLLLAAIARLGTQFFTVKPALPESFPKLDKIGAKIGHILLYVWMFALPITGWIMVSSSVYGLPTIVFNMFEWPHIPGIEGNKTINGLSNQAHELLAYAFMAIIGLHIAGVIKHAIMDKENLLTRMSIALKRK